VSREWLAEVKAGDEVGWERGYGPQRDRRIVTVERTTPTQIIVRPYAGEIRFSRKLGREIGADRYFATRLFELTPENRTQVAEQMERQRCLHALAVVKWDTLPTETLRAVVERITTDRRPHDP